MGIIKKALLISILIVVAMVFTLGGATMLVRSAMFACQIHATKYNCNADIRHAYHR